MTDIFSMQEDSRKRFDELSSERESLIKQLEELNAEMIRIQGEYRAYESILNSKKTTEDANTISVEEEGENGQDKSKV